MHECAKEALVSSGYFVMQADAGGTPLLFKIGLPQRKLGQLFIGAVVIAFALVQHGDPFHLIGGEGKIKDVQVVPDMVHISAAGDHRKAHLGVPAKDHLSGSLSVLAAQLGEHALMDKSLVSVAQWIPAHQPDAVFVQGFAQLCLGVIGVRLHLDELRRDLPLSFQLGDVFALKVGDADGLRLALAVRLLQLPVAASQLPAGWWM